MSVASFDVLFEIATETSSETSAIVSWSLNISSSASFLCASGEDEPDRKVETLAASYSFFGVLTSEEDLEETDSENSVSG